MREALAPVVFTTPDSHSHFFGYYDKCPLDRDGTRLLVHRVDFDGRDVAPGDQAEVGYYTLATQAFTRLGVTDAFNFQQGAMLQWVPGDGVDKVVYNERVGSREEAGSRCRAVVVDLGTGARRELDGPVYAVHPGGAYAVTLAFERLHACRRGYHYPGVCDPAFEGRLPAGDGIFRVDLTTGACTRLVSLAAIAERLGVPEGGGRVWLEHLMWNPSGTRFACMLRTELPGGQFWTRLFTADTGGEQLFAFPNTGVYSHMGWRNDEELTVWALIPNAVASARAHRQRPWFQVLRRLYRAAKRRLPAGVTAGIGPRTGYVSFRDHSDGYRVVADGQLVDDGHNTWSSDGRFMLTDTYADAAAQRSLLLYDSATEEVYRLGGFRSPFNDCGYRCDLHPRLAEAQQQVVVDSAHSGRRQVVVVDASAALSGGR